MNERNGTIPECSIAGGQRAAEPAVPELAVSLVPSVQHPVASSMPHPPDRIPHG